MSSEPRLAQRLTDAIAEGAYRPGEWLKQVDLAATFGATRFEVRRALEELALRKTVLHVPQRGYRVGMVTEDELANFRAVRVVLEVEACRLLADRITPADITELEALAAQFATAVDRGTPAERSRSNHRFHDTMYAIAGNPVLSELIREVRDRARGTQIHLWPSVQSMRQSADEHDDIIAALKAGGFEPVAAAVRRHILKDGDRPS